MDITKLSFVARKRTAWEVFDLTQLMVKSNFIPMMRIVVLLYMPLGLILWSIFSIETASIIMWWLKPLLERPLLDFLAKKSFSQPTTAWSCIQSIRYLSITDILTILTINRFSPNRAYLASIEQLEKLKGNSKASRKNVLLSHGKHKQTFWMIFCVHVEFLFTLLLLVTALNFIPQGIKVDDQFLISNLTSGGFEEIYYLSYLVAVQLVAPYFVTGGFLAYLNTRVNLEAWDLELAFKQIANRVNKAAAAVIVMVFTCFMDIPSVTAAEVQAEPIQRQEKPLKLSAAELTRLKVQNIYQENQLIEKTFIWKPITEESKDSFDLAWLEEFFKKISGLGNVIGYIFWIILIVLIVWLAAKLYSIRGESRLNAHSVQIKKSAQEVNIPSFFSEIVGTSWPNDLLFAAEQANNESKYREALTYVLRFSLLLAERYSSVTIQISMTERECEKALISALPIDFHTQYRKLFSVWIQQAWAHKKANKHQVDELISAFRDMEALGNKQ